MKTLEILALTSERASFEHGTTATAQCAGDGTLHSFAMGKKYYLNATPYDVRRAERRQQERGARACRLHSPARHYDRAWYPWRDNDVAQMNLSLEQRQEKDKTRKACNQSTELAPAPDAPDAGREALWLQLRTAKESWDAHCDLRMGKYVAFAKAKKQTTMAGSAAGMSTLGRIEFDLTNMQFDTTTLERTLYVSEIHAFVDATLLTKLFAPFGLEVSHSQCRSLRESDLTCFFLPQIDESTGFPCVDLFLSERTHRPRGDARLVFTSADGAARAVEEMQSA